jgi:hypothetical protein
MPAGSFSLRLKSRTAMILQFPGEKAALGEW